MINSLPKVSIGLPVYNGERYLAKALNALISQTYSNIEIIILDNDSNDLTKKISQDYLILDVRIKYFINANNIGPFPNINKVFTLATGDFYMWAAYDDLWEKDYVETLVGLLVRNNNAILAFSLETRIGESDEHIKTFDLVSNIFHISDSKFSRVFKFIIFNNQESLASLFYGIYKRNLIKNIGGFTDFENDYWGRDLHFLLKVLLIGNFVQVNRSLFYKRVIAEKPYSFSQLKGLHYIKKYIKNINTDSNQNSIKHTFLQVINYFIKNIHNWNQIYFGYSKIILRSNFNFFEKLFILLTIYIVLIKNILIEVLRSFRRFQIITKNTNVR
jgi:glycosyltransferase involved in cell wall biosynthesis